MIVKKVQLNISITLILLLFLTSKLLADESVSNSDETAVEKEKQPVSDKTQDSKADEPEPQSNEDDKGNEIKSDKCEPQSENDDSKSQNARSEVSNRVKVADPKTPVENIEEGNSQSDTQNDKSGDVGVKKEDSNNTPENTDVKKQSSKDESNQKTDLNDVNFLKDEENHSGFEKREAYRESLTEYLGLPRDASYFFDDLEPFINSSNDNRVGRSASLKESKGQKSKLSKGREVIEVDDADEDEDDLRNEDEEDEKQNEDDYDDDDDADSDCQPTTPPCTTKPQCTTTPVTCSPPTTTKCTTKFTCPTTCRTTTLPTICPRICVKATRRQHKNCGDDSSAALDVGIKKIKKIKRRNHEKEN